jgi:DNA-nicking Smr family endonuclease
MIEIDLHGLKHQQAIEAVETLLIGESQKGSFQIRIITGKSSDLQIRIIQEVLDTHGFQWETPTYNQGELIVTYTKL